LKQYTHIYFIGIGGIGMSALARYFLQEGYRVSGYDKTPSLLTDQLSSEGASIHFEDLGATVADRFEHKESVLVVYTPAIPSEMGELNYFQSEGYEVLKRAQLLGRITKEQQTLAVAGTHGKTTTSSMLAHVLDASSRKCNAFLGGISTNFNSNYKGDVEAAFAVVEADEFDRSFLNLSPFASIVTTTDADHLDIYGDSKEFSEGFRLYADCVSELGFLVCYEEVELNHKSVIRYGRGNENDYQLLQVRSERGRFTMDVSVKGAVWSDVLLGLPGEHNALNALAVLAMLNELGFSSGEIRNGLKTFKGVKRRFEYQLNTEDIIFIDDYAHHPTEISALVGAVKQLYPDKRIKGIFQPHLFSRTRDFFDGFAEELSKLDELILMPIYPAREKPIEGVTSERLLLEIEGVHKKLLSADDIINEVTCSKNEVLLTIGAGDIDRIVKPLKLKLQGETVD
jgi:UDP-N-acetylmuramate--alanine ligase